MKNRSHFGFEAEQEAEQEEKQQNGEENQERCEMTGNAKVTAAAEKSGQRALFY